MSSFSIDELRAFVAVFEAGGFTPASKRLTITINAVSLRIQKLEEALNTQLFVRTTRSVVPTDAARAFYERVSRVLEDLDAAQDALRAVDARLQCAVRIAMPGALATPPFFRRLRQLLQAHPELSVQTHITDTPGNISATGFDVILIVGQPPESTFVAHHMGQVTNVLAAAPLYLERHGRPLLPAALAQHCCLPLLSSTDPYEWTLVGQNEVVKTVQVHGSYHADDSRTISDALYCGLGIGALPLGECSRAETEGLLERVLPEYRLAPLDIYALVLKRRVGIPPIVACLDVLRAAILER